MRVLRVVLCGALVSLTAACQSPPNQVALIEVAAFSTLTVSPTRLPAVAGIESAEVTVTVIDAQGNPVPGVTVAVRSDRTVDSVSQPLQPTDAAGVATASIGSNTPGVATLSATVRLEGASVNLAATAQVEFTDPFEVAASPTRVPADGVSTSTVTARFTFPVDFLTASVTLVSNRNPASGTAVDIINDETVIGDLPPLPITPDANDAVVFRVRSRQPGTATLTARASIEGIFFTDESVDVTFEPSVRLDQVASASDLNASPVDVPADGNTPSIVRVTVRDSNATPLAGATVVIASDRAGDVITQPTLPTDENGIARAEIRSTNVGRATVSATVNPGPNAIAIVDTAEVRFFVDPVMDAVGASSEVTAAPPSVPADGTSTSTVTVKLQGAGGAPGVRFVVTLESSRGAADTIAPASSTGAITDGNGLATFTVSSSTPGTATFSAKIHRDPFGLLRDIPIVDTADVEFVDPMRDAIASTSEVTTIPTAVAADGSSASTIRITLKGTNGLPIQGATVTVSGLRAEDALTQPSAPTDASGQTTAQIRSTLSGVTQVRVTVTSRGAPFELAARGNVTFFAVREELAANSLIVASPPTVNANGTDTSAITVTLRDARGNPAGGLGVTLSSSRGSVDTLSVLERQGTSPGEGITDQNGVALFSVSSTTPGTAVITARILRILDPDPVLTRTASVTFTATATPLRIETFTANKSRVQQNGLVTFDWLVTGDPTTQTLPGGKLAPDDRSVTFGPVIALDELDPFAGLGLTVFDASTTRVTLELDAAAHAGGGRAMGNAVAAFAKGGHVVAGRFEDTTTFASGVSRTAVGGGPNLSVAWYDRDHVLLDVKTAGGGDYAEAFATAAHPNGDVVVCGASFGTFAAGAGEPGAVSFGNSSSFDAVILYYNANRTLRWAKREGGAGFDQCLKAAVAPNGDAVVAGQFDQAATFGAGERNAVTRTPLGSFDIFLARYAARDGSLVFAKAGGGTRLDTVGAVRAAADGSIFLAGGFGNGGAAGEIAVFDAGEASERTLTQAGAGDPFFAKYNGDGSLSKIARAGGASFDSVTAAAPAPEGGLYIAGPLTGTATFGAGANEIMLTSSGGTSHFIVRTDRNFAPVFGRVVDGTGPLLEISASDATVDGVLAVTGSLNGSANWNFGRPDATQLDSGGTKVTFVVTMKPDGSLELVRKEGGPGETKGRGIAATQDGTFVVTGLFSGTSTFGRGETGATTFTATAIEEMYALHLPPLNSRTIAIRRGGFGRATSAGSPNLDRPNAIAATQAGESVIIGETQPLTGNVITFGTGGPTIQATDNITFDFIVRYDLAGTVKCAARLRQGGFGVARGLAAYENGDSVIGFDFFVDSSITPDDTIVDPNGPSPIGLASAGSTDIGVARFDKLCRVIWAKRAGAASNDQVFGVAPLIDGGAAIAFAYANAAIFGAGETAGNGNEGQTTLPDMSGGGGGFAVFNKDGTLRFVRRVGGTGFTEQSPEGVAAYPNGDIALAGSCSGTCFFDPGMSFTPTGHDAFVVRYSAAGNPLWIARAAGGPKAFCKRIAIDRSTGDVIVVGEFLGTITFDPGGQNVSFTNPSATATDVFVARYRGSNGAFVWAQQMAGPEEDVVRGVDVFSDGRIIVAGGFNGTATFGRVGDPRRTMLSTGGDFNEDIFVVILEPNGDIVSVKQTGGSGNERANGVAALADGSALVAGEFGSTSLVFGAGEANAQTLTKVGGFRDVFWARFFPYEL